MCIRMGRVLVEVNGIGNLYNLAKVHNRDFCGNILNYRKIMSNKEKGKSKLFLEIRKQVQNLRLY